MSVNSQVYKPFGKLSAAPMISKFERNMFNWIKKCNYLTSFNEQFKIDGNTKFIGTFVI